MLGAILRATVLRPELARPQADAFVAIDHDVLPRFLLPLFRRNNVPATRTFLTAPGTGSRRRR